MSERDNLLDEITNLKAQAQLKALDTQLTDQQPQGSFGGNALRLFSQGLSFGTADEIEAFARSLFGEKTYAETWQTTFDTEYAALVTAYTANTNPMTTEAYTAAENNAKAAANTAATNAKNTVLGA